MKLDNGAKREIESEFVVVVVVVVVVVERARGTEEGAA